MEIKMPTSNKDDRYYIYLRSPSNNYYFFGFKQGILNVFSNSKNFQDAFDDLKEKDRMVEIGKDQILEYQWGNESTTRSFINRVKAASGAN